MGRFWYCAPRLGHRKHLFDPSSRGLKIIIWAHYSEWKEDGNIRCAGSPVDNRGTSSNHVIEVSFGVSTDFAFGNLSDASGSLLAFRDM
mmetsp:Transcript_88010/g.172190  ORF Transcript_88010/g.172190 Transcript_88010/m.172190 type:complete len:89 (+) Transcript_88010:2834-3100(+)